MLYSPQQFVISVIHPALNRIGLWSPAAGQLLLATALQESQLTWRTQFKHGPARGLFQMELSTHADIWKNVLDLPGRHHLRDKILSILHGQHREFALERNDQYGAAMARLQYWRHQHDPMPGYNDIPAMAKLYKRRYNGPGKATPEVFVSTWRHHMTPRHAETQRSA